MEQPKRDQRVMGFFMLPKEAQFNLGEGRGRVNVTLQTRKPPEEYRFTTLHQLLPCSDSLIHPEAGKYVHCSEDQGQPFPKAPALNGLINQGKL